MFSSCRVCHPSPFYHRCGLSLSLSLTPVPWKNHILLIWTDCTAGVRVWSQSDFLLVWNVCTLWLIIIIAHRPGAGWWYNQTSYTHDPLGRKKKPVNKCKINIFISNLIQLFDMLCFPAPRAPCLKLLVYLWFQLARSVNCVSQELFPHMPYLVLHTSEPERLHLYFKHFLIAYKS